MNANRTTAIADAIVDWPTELCSIVADYAIPPVAWSYNQAAGIQVVDDGRIGVVAASMDRLPEDAISSIDGIRYRRLIGRQPLGETSTKWTIELNVGPDFNISIRFRVGICLSDGTVLTCPELFYERRTGTTVLRRTSFSTSELDPTTVRFTFAADLRTGFLTTTVRSTADDFPPADDWFSVRLEPIQLAQAFPVVYFWHVGSTAKLVDS